MATAWRPVHEVDGNGAEAEGVVGVDGGLAGVLEGWPTMGRGARVLALQRVCDRGVR